MAERAKAKKEDGANSLVANLTTDAKRQKALEMAMEQIEKQFGKGAIMRLGQSEIDDIEAISTGSLSLDIALGIGGLPMGRIIEIYGPESTGKTTLTLELIAQAQKKGKICAFIDAEHALDPVYAKKLGVQVENVFISQPDTGEQALEICETLVRSGGIDLVVIDSVAALVPKAEIEGEITTQVGTVQTALDTAEAAIDALEAKTVQVSDSATETLGATTKALATKEYVDTQMASAGTLTSVELKKGTEAQANSLILAVNGSDQNVVALGSAAFTESSAYATAAQGTKADTAYQKPEGGIPETDLASAVQAKLTSAASALQASDITLGSGTNNGTLKLTVKGSETDNIAVKGLGSAAYTEASAYATAAQGTKADTALQPAGVVITEGDTNGAISVKIGGAPASSVSVHGLGDAAYTTVAAIVAEAVEAVPEVPAATTAVAGIAKLGAAGGAATFEAVQSLTTTVGAKADQSVVDSLTARVAAIEALLSSDEYDIFFVKKQA